MFVHHQIEDLSQNKIKIKKVYLILYFVHSKVSILYGSPSIFVIPVMEYKLNKMPSNDFPGEMDCSWLSRRGHLARTLYQGHMAPVTYLLRNPLEMVLNIFIILCIFMLEIS